MLDAGYWLLDLRGAGLKAHGARFNADESGCWNKASGVRIHVSAQPLATGGGQFDQQKKLMNIEHRTSNIDNLVKSQNYQILIS